MPLLNTGWAPPGAKFRKFLLWGGLRRLRRERPTRSGWASLGRALAGIDANRGTAFRAVLPAVRKR